MPWQVIENGRTNNTTEPFQEKFFMIVILRLTRRDIVILRDKAKLRDIVIPRDMVLLRGRGENIFSVTDRSRGTVSTCVDALYLHKFIS